MPYDKKKMKKGREQPLECGLFLAFLGGAVKAVGVHPLKKGREMIALKTAVEPPRPSEMETLKQIEEAAYYCYLNRIQYAQTGNELCDWIEAENKVRNKLTPAQNKLFALTSTLKKIFKKKSP